MGKFAIGNDLTIRTRFILIFLQKPSCKFKIAISRNKNVFNGVKFPL